VNGGRPRLGTAPAARRAFASAGRPGCRVARPPARRLASGLVGRGDRRRRHARLDPLAAALATQLLHGTDSVGVRSVVAEVAPRHTVCVPNLNLARRHGPHSACRVRTQAKLPRPGAGDGSGQNLASTMSGNPGRARSSTRTLRYRPTGLADVSAGHRLPHSVGRAGRARRDGGASGQPVADLVDRAPVPNRVSVWFLPPAGQQRSLLSSASEISRGLRCFARVVGAWNLPVPPVRRLRSRGRSRCCCSPVPHPTVR